MLSMIRSNLTARRGRTLALLVGLLVATTSFVVLTGAAEQQRLDVVGTVNANARSAYDILVRPAGSRTSLEDSTSLVQSSYLANTPSGITMAQYDQIRSMTGVEIAAPLALIGYVMQTAYVPIDVTDLLTSATDQVLRISTTRTTDGGLSTMDDQAQFLYVTRNQTSRRVVSDRPGTALFEIAPDGSAEPICDYYQPDARTPTPFSAESRDILDCQSANPQNSNLRNEGGVLYPDTYPAGHIIAQVGFTYPFLLAAIDPDAEARISGLAAAIDDGRYLSPTDVPTYEPADPNRGSVRQLPLIAADRPYIDDQLTVQIDNLDVDPATVPHAGPREYSDLETAPGQQAKTVTLDNSTALRSLIGQMDGLGDYFTSLFDQYWRVGPATFEQTGATTAAAQPTTVAPDAWKARTPNGWVTALPAVTADTAFRPLEPISTVPDQYSSTQYIYTNAVGSFDPTKLADEMPLGGAPLDTYVAPSATAGATTLLPTANPAGYLQQPPTLLTTLAGLRLFSDPDLFGDAAASPAPINVIRVRAAGITGFDDVNREKVRLLAEQIHEATGLDVDIVIGSSLSPVSVSLPAGKFGRPALVAEEPWIHKGVAVAILKAVDRKSLALSVLILAVCALFAANASGAAVRARRSEFSVLAAVGWPPGYQFRLALGEMGLIGLVAGVAGALLAWPIGRFTGIAVSPLRAATVIPAAVLLALAAGAIPAWRAAQTRPAQSLAAGTTAPRKHRRARMRRSVPTVTGLGLGGVRRVPSRTLLGVVSVAIGTAALTPLLAITAFFHGAVVGSVLGDAVSIQVRGSDLATVVAIIAMGVLALADVLYLNVRERVHEYTVLRVVGWRERALARLVVTEGLGIGILGALLGAALGLGATAALVGGAWASVALAAGAAAIASSLLAGLASLVPAALLRRLAPAPVLADE